MRLRVGLVGAGWRPDPGGVETVTAALAGELTRRGHEVFALALDRSGRAEEGSARDERVEGVALRRVAWTHSSERHLRELAGSARLLEAALAWVGDAGPDVVHLHSLVGWGLELPPRLRALGVPALWTLHDYWSLCARGQMFDREGASCERVQAKVCGECVAATWPHLAGDEEAPKLVEQRLGAARSAWEACASVLSPSRAALDVFEAHGLRGGVHCENGVDAPSVPARRAHAGPLRVGVLGAVQPSKGVLELARHLVDDPRFELHVHGPRPDYHGDRSYARDLEELARRSERLHLHGPFAAAELGEVLAGLDAVAVPSRWREVFGLAAREARAAGLPVVVAPRGGLVEGDLSAVATEDGAGWREALGALHRGARGGSPHRVRTLAQMADQLEEEYARALAD